MQQVWDVEISPYTQFYYETQSSRLAAAIELIHENYADFTFLREQHPVFLHLLKQAYGNPINARALFQLIALLHSIFYTQQADWTEWIWHLKQAIALCSQAEFDEADAYLKYFLASVLHLSGNLELAKDVGANALELAQKQDDTKLLAAIASTLIGIAISQELDQALVLRMIEKIEAHASTGTVDKAAKATSMIRMSLARIRLLRLQGKLVEALERAHQAIEWSKFVKSDLLLSKAEAQIQAHRLCGLIFWALGQSKNAAKHFRKAIHIAKRDGLVFLEAWTHGNLGLLLWHNGSLLKAEGEIRLSIQILEKLKANQQLVAQVGNLALVLLFQGRLREAFGLVEKQKDLATYYGLHQEFYRAIGNRGAIHFHLGQFQAAINDLQEDVEFSSKFGLHEGIINNYINIGRCYHALGQAQLANEYIQKALENSNSLESIALKGIALRGLAEIQTGEQQRQTLETALLLNELRQFDRAACLLSLSENYGSSALGEKYWHEGKKLLLKCGGLKWLKNSVDGKILYLPTLT